MKHPFFPLFYIIAFDLSFPLIVASQPVVEWTQVFNEPHVVYTNTKCVRQTFDEGFIIAGSFEKTAFLIKTDNTGNKQWLKTYSDNPPLNSYAVANCVQQIRDGGFIVAGTITYGVPMDRNSDLWVFKTDASGNIQWTQKFGDSCSTKGNSIIQTKDDGFFVSGEGDSLCNDCSMFKLNTRGTLEWSTCYPPKPSPGSKHYVINSVLQTIDGGFVGIGDPGLIKMDSSGKEEWINTYGEVIKFGHQTDDEGFILLSSNYIIKTDSQGTEQWRRKYKDYLCLQDGYSVQQLKDGGFLIVGNGSRWIRFRAKNSIRPTNNKNFLISSQDFNMRSIIDGYYQALLKTDKYGFEKWNGTGWENGDFAYWGSAQQTNDGGSIIAGSYYRASGYSLLMKLQPEIPTPDYCVSSGKHQNYEYIKTVQISNMINDSTASNYAFYYNKIINASNGKKVFITLTPGFTNASYSEYWKIWIDYNNDGDFIDVNEEVFSRISNAQIKDSFVVTQNTLLPTRLRVSMKYGGYPSPCEEFAYGEVEDYVVTFDKYAVSFGNSQSDEYINKIVLNYWSIGSDPSKYTFYKDKEIFLRKGSNATIKLIPGFTNSSYTEYWKVWIDYNADNDFDEPNEEVFKGFSNTEIGGAFTVSDSPGSPTRLRVSMKYGSYPSPNEEFPWGEVKDFYCEMQ